MSEELNSEIEDDDKITIRVLFYTLEITSEGKLKKTYPDEEIEDEYTVTVEDTSFNRNRDEETYHFEEDDVVDDGYYYEFIRDAIGLNNAPFVVEVYCYAKPYYWFFDEEGHDITNDVIAVDKFGETIEF